MIRLLTIFSALVLIGALAPSSRGQLVDGSGGTEHDVDGPRIRGPVPPGDDEVTFTVSVVARSGDEPPDRPGETFTTFSDPVVNAAGQVAFKGNFNGPLSGNEGIYRFDPGTNQLVRVVDDSFDFNPPGQSGATSWTSFGPPVIDDSGQVLFRGSFSFGDNSQGLYVHDGAAAQLVFDDNPLQPVPGQPGAIGFTVFPLGAGILPLLSANGYGVTTATFFDAVFVEMAGVYLGDVATGIVRVADEGMQPPRQPPTARFTDFDLFMCMNDIGDAAFHGEYTAGVGTHGVYRYVRSTPELVRIADGTVTPPGQFGATKFSTLDGFVSMNDAGEVAFHGFYSGGVPAGAEGVFAGDGVSPLRRVADDSGAVAVPDHPTKSFQAFGFPVIDGAGDVVFSAVFGGGTADAGLFRERGGVLERVLDFGDVVPGQPGASFFALGNVACNASGHIAFAARYSGGSGDEGVYWWDGAQLVRVLDESDTSLGLTLTNLHMLLGVGGTGGQDGKPSTLGDGDHVVFRATLTGGDEAILLATRS